MSQKSQPTNRALWSRAKSEAKKRFDVYPSAYANQWAAKWYKEHGGTWKTVAAESKRPIKLKEKFLTTISPNHETWAEIFVNPTRDEWDSANERKLDTTNIPVELRRSEDGYTPTYGNRVYVLGGLYWDGYVFIWNRNSASHLPVISAIAEKMRKQLPDNDYTALYFYYAPDGNVVMVDYAANTPNSSDMKQYRYTTPPDFTERLRKMSRSPVFKNLGIVDIQGNVIKEPPTKKKKKPMTESIMDELFEKIIRVGKKYRLVSKKTGKNLGTYPTKAGALKRERQVQFFKHQK